MRHTRLLPAGLAVLLLLVMAAGAWSRSGGAPSTGGDADGARYRLASAGAASSAPVLPTPAPLHFAASVAAGDQQVVRDAIASARPEARRLVELVAGLVTVSVSSPGRSVAGEMRSIPSGYAVELDLGPVYRASGMRGVRRLALHELAHVVDHALVPTAMKRELDAATPAGLGCDDGGRSGACAVREERFAESFAKWATGDIGVDIHLGYRVPPPTSLQHWGDPLAAIAR